MDKMAKFLRIVQKNFLLWWRSKISVLALLFGPLFLIILVGSAFNNAESYTITAGVYSENYTLLTDQIIDEISKEFEVIKSESNASCINDLKQGNTHICILFSEDLSMENINGTNEIIFYVDYSKINLAWAVVDLFSAQISSQSSKISMNLTTEVLNKLKQTRTELQNKSVLISKIITRDTEIRENLVDVQGDIVSVNSFLDLISLNLSGLEGSNKEIKERITSISNNILSAKAKVDDLNTSQSNKNEINNILDNTLSDLRTINQTHLSNFNSLINNIRTELNKATTLIKSTNENILNVTALLNQSLTDLSSVESSVNGIISNISSIKVTDAEYIVHPITTTINPVAAKKNYLSYALPTLMVLLVMFTSVLLSSSLIGIEKKSKAFFRNFISPTKNITFVLARFTTDITLVLLQLGIFILIAILFLKSSLIIELGNILAILFLVATMFIFLGMAIGYLSTSQEGAVLIAVFLSSIMLFMSGAIIPVESMPPAMQTLVKLNPFVISENLLRKTIVHHLSLASLGFGVFVLLGYSLILFTLAFVATKYAKKL